MEGIPGKDGLAGFPNHAAGGGLSGVSVSGGKTTMGLDGGL